jgi:hypothetical protein
MHVNCSVCFGTTESCLENKPSLVAGERVRAPKHSRQAAPSSIGRAPIVLPSCVTRRCERMPLLSRSSARALTEPRRRRCATSPTYTWTTIVDFRPSDLIRTRYTL